MLKVLLKEVKIKLQSLTLAHILCGVQRFFDIFYLSLTFQRRIGTLGGIPAQNVAKDRCAQAFKLINL